MKWSTFRLQGQYIYQIRQPDFVLDRICYDDACHLKKYCMNPKRKRLTAVAERLATMDMVIDKMHFRNHVDNWCKTNCNPYDRKDLDGVSYLDLILFISQ